jgi:PIN domain nuclease of toxin-antitoxin system
VNAFDSSAILALAFAESGASKVARLLRDAPAFLSTVSLAEVFGRYLRVGTNIDALRDDIMSQDIEIVPFDATDAELLAKLEPATKRFGLSLGDRACLALAIRCNLSVVTADRNWARVEDLPIALDFIR